MTVPIWAPSPERIARANITLFRRQLAERIAPNLTSYPELYHWSVKHAEQFWPALWDYCRVIASRPADQVVENFDRMPGARWFPGARLNFAENLLRFRGEDEAIIAWNESGRQSVMTSGELFHAVGAVASVMRSWGVSAGDRVAGYLPNLPETVIAMLAAASIGAIWTSCSPDFGLEAVADRFGQTEPRILFTAASYQYNGKCFPYLERAGALARRLPSLERTVVVPYLEEPGRTELPSRAVTWGQVMEQGAGAEPRFEQLPFDHPLYILYSSGTTGKPKCIVHGAGGTLLQHLKEHLLHTDVRRGDRMVYFTTCGWMMWNWLVSSLAAGATIILYDGSPLFPGAGALWRLAEAERVSIFGTSAKYLSAIEKAGCAPLSDYNLAPLRTILSTGSPLAPESFDYVYRSISRDVCLSSISGGTDIISCFALGNPAAPVYRGELQTRGLGMAVEVFNQSGQPVAGEKGELVCTRPFPSMPVKFWNDPGGEKYRRAYFSYFPNVWRHGDWAEITFHDGVIIHGRSDAVLNPGGVRIGTAEIYRIVEQLPGITEALVAGQEWMGDVRVILFLRLDAGAALDDELAANIRRSIREKASPRHVPAKIIAVDDIPRTRNNKISELAVREVIHGRPVTNSEALLNPEALELYRDLEELR